MPATFSGKFVAHVAACLLSCRQEPKKSRARQWERSSAKRVCLMPVTYLGLKHVLPFSHASLRLRFCREEESAKMERVYSTLSGQPTDTQILGAVVCGGFGFVEAVVVPLPISALCHSHGFTA